MPAPLLTIGYGSRSIDTVIELLRANGVRYLVDVRSSPYSKYKPEFSRDQLRAHLRLASIAYGFLGAELGGRPNDPDCYDATGRVDYEACRARPAFQEGIQRLLDGWSRGHEIAILCSEERPEECHRTKLVAPALIDAGVDVWHIDEVGDIMRQDEVLSRLVKGQPSLFGDLPVAATRSRGRYRETES